MVYYNPDPGDNITACSGRSKKDAARGFKEGVFRASPSIVNMAEHKYNIAALNPSRAHHLWEMIVSESQVTRMEYNTPKKATL